MEATMVRTDRIIPDVFTLTLYVFQGFHRGQVYMNCVAAAICGDHKRLNLLLFCTH
jgi:hypothetical protein